MRDWSERLGFWCRWHAHVLARKGIDDAVALRAAIDHDRVVALSATRTLTGLRVRALLADFFLDHIGLRDDVLGLTDEEAVNHLGFQIREPLDVWLEGLAHWAPRLRFEVVGTKRFTPSEAFRERVGAMTEMAQVWLRRDGDEGRPVELELFDIHRRDPTATSRIEQLRAGPGTRELLAAAVPEVWRSVVADDDIWHYGVRIVDHAAVEEIHRRFRSLVVEDERFRLRTGRTVANAWHGSVHTKLTNVESDTEIEFLTYAVDWSAVTT